MFVNLVVRFLINYLCLMPFIQKNLFYYFNISPTEYGQIAPKDEPERL